ncbi:MAG: Rpn family recombination-promoting nuclease/putative transposase [Turicibacter sp.]|nr:Rpn family recombination-promoting nuclease/putative transposase [Turicibacter sp.]
MKKDRKWLDNLDFSQLMDLRVDYAFKLIFGTGKTIFLISLLNAIFASAGIRRIIKSLTILSPNLEKRSEQDKLSILDVRAELDDGSDVLIEMHLYDLLNLKYKTIRSWARAYGENLKAGEEYRLQKPVICVSFVSEAFDEKDADRIHKCCKIADIASGDVFTDVLELHYINMKAFIKAINGMDKADMADKPMLEKWLAVITEKDVADKAVIKAICEQEEDINMAVAELELKSMDKYERQAYQRRQDDILLYFMNINNRDKKIAEQERALADKNKVLANKDKALADKDKILADKDKALADKDKILAEERKAREEQDKALAKERKAREEQAKALADKDRIIAELLAKHG